MPAANLVPSKPLRWDIFCQVIDNLGDLGVCWRLSSDLARRGHHVRLWVDEPSALAWMAPCPHPSVQVMHWRQGPSPGAGRPLELGDAVVAAFSCELDEATTLALGERARSGKPCFWVNLEYLSAEGFSGRAHGKAAPVMHGPAAGAPRLAYYPGFTLATGGLLREPDLAQTRTTFDRAAWLAQRGVRWRDQTLVSMFCYEPALLRELLAGLARRQHETLMLVCAGRGAEAVRDALALSSPTPPSVRSGNLTLHWLPYLPQPEFDHLLWSCDLNFVRGEDSLVRAIWAGRAFVWQAYPQHDDAHRPKFSALLDQMHAPQSLRRFMERWNGMDSGPGWSAASMPGPAAIAGWSSAVQAWRETLLQQTDLTSQLIRLAARGS